MEELKARMNLDIEETRAWFRTSKSVSA
jgi:hypothetical protein